MKGDAPQCFTARSEAGALGWGFSTDRLRTVEAEPWRQNDGAGAHRAWRPANAPRRTRPAAELGGEVWPGPPRRHRRAPGVTARQPARWTATAGGASRRRSVRAVRPSTEPKTSTSRPAAPRPFCKSHPRSPQSAPKVHPERSEGVPERTQSNATFVVALAICSEESVEPGSRSQRSPWPSSREIGRLLGLLDPSRS